MSHLENNYVFWNPCVKLADLTYLKVTIQALLIFDPLITLWGNFDAPYLKLLNDASVASACFYVRTCRRVRNSKKIATIRDFHLPGSFLCLSTRLLSGLICLFFWGQFFKERIYRATCELFRLTPAAEGHDQLCHETAFITSVIMFVSLHDTTTWIVLTAISPVRTAFGYYRK